MTAPGIHLGTVRLVAQRLNHYATPDPIWYSTSHIIIISSSSIPVSIVNITEINGLIDEKSVMIKTGYCIIFSKSFEDTMQYSLT